MSELDRLLTSYPRARPPLSSAHERVYEQEYKLNRRGDRAIEGLAKKLEGWMHQQVARHRGAPVLELGAGTLNHLPFEPGVEPYDIVEPFKALYEDSPLLYRVRDAFDTQADVPEGRRYRRIVSIAVLEHMTDLPRELARSGLALEDGGVFQAGIPSEGGLLWWLGWRCTTGMTYFLRTKLDYGVLMRHEHVNEAPEIMSLVRYFFEDVTARRFPLPLHHLSLYVYIEARQPRRDRCHRALDRNA